MKTYIADVYPSKAQFLKGENINIIVEMINENSKIENVEIEVNTLFLNKRVEAKKYITEIASETKKEIILDIDPKEEDFKGYGVDVFLYINKELVQVFSSSFDVVSDYRKALRYGFLTGFSNEDIGDEEDIKSMSKFHLNIVQFYDWMYRHDDFIPPEAEFQDLMGRNLNMNVVKEKIEYCHRYNMKAVAYGAVYAASKPYYDKHKNWGLYNSSGNPLSLGELFYIMNISRECPWHKHIIGEYKKAVAQIDFDGIHMDTYGFPKTAVSKINDENRILHMEQLFPMLINDTREELERVKENTCLIFNNVGNWPVDSVAKAHQDASYIEVWKPYERYFQIKDIINWAKASAVEKPVILAAYLKPFYEEAKGSMEKAYESFKLLTAVIAANGGYHLILGENKGILNQGYYVNYSRIEDEHFYRTIRCYYDFIVRYSNIFYNNTLKDVSMTHVDGDNLEYVFENCNYSTYGEPDKVWVIVKEKEDQKVINFINLSNNEDYWNKGKNKPTPIRGMKVRILIDMDVKSIFIASPDLNMGRPQEISYSIEEGIRGKILVVKLPELNLWNILNIEFK